jgi:hypothetical protein
MQKLSSYHKENTTRLHDNSQSVDAVLGNIAVYCENLTKNINTLGGESAELLNGKVYGTTGHNSWY